MAPTMQRIQNSGTGSGGGCVDEVPRPLRWLTMKTGTKSFRTLSPWNNWYDHPFGQINSNLQEFGRFPVHTYILTNVYCTGEYLIHRLGPLLTLGALLNYSAVTPEAIGASTVRGFEHQGASATRGLAARGLDSQRLWQPRAQAPSGQSSKGHRQLGIWQLED